MFGDDAIANLRRLDPITGPFSIGIFPFFVRI